MVNVVGKKFKGGVFEITLEPPPFVIPSVARNLRSAKILDRDYPPTLGWLEITKGTAQLALTRRFLLLQCPQYFLGGNWQVHDADTGRIVDRVGDGSRHRHVAALSDALAIEGRGA